MFLIWWLNKYNIVLKNLYYVPYYLKEIHTIDIVRKSGAGTSLQWEGGGKMVKRVVTKIKPSETQEGSVTFHMLVNIQV